MEGILNQAHISKKISQGSSKAGEKNHQEFLSIKLD